MNKYKLSATVYANNESDAYIKLAELIDDELDITPLFSIKRIKKVKTDNLHKVVDGRIIAK